MPSRPRPACSLPLGVWEQDGSVFLNSPRRSDRAVNTPGDGTVDEQRPAEAGGGEEGSGLWGCADFAVEESNPGSWYWMRSRERCLE